MSLQLSCSDICQIWIWFSGSRRLYGFSYLDSCMISYYSFIASAKLFSKVRVKNIHHICIKEQEVIYAKKNSTSHFCVNTCLSPIKVYRCERKIPQSLFTQNASGAIILYFFHKWVWLNVMKALWYKKRSFNLWHLKIALISSDVMPDCESKSKCLLDWFKLNYIKFCVIFSYWLLMI